MMRAARLPACYFSRMSFFTDVTPLMPRANRTAAGRVVQDVLRQLAAVCAEAAAAWRPPPAKPVTATPR